MKAAISRAIANVVNYGDTDIFPYPEDNLAIKSDSASVEKICQDLHKDLDKSLSNYPPDFYESFIPNGYTGFRWATQIDAFWNIYLLSLVIKLGDKIESARIPASSNIVHSYRFQAGASPDLWDRKYGWKSFYDKSSAISDTNKFVVVCDISEFYRRIYHHRLENALKQIDNSDIPSRIMKILGVFSRTTSYGLPVGGPSARLLSELVLNQIDHLLQSSGYEFCRFADDYVIGARDKSHAYDALLFISEKLQINQGLALQRAKTRILSGAEYRASRPFIFDEDDESDLAIREKHKLFKINVFYDPYSPTAPDDYETLKHELSHLDIIYLLNHEIKKSRIHIPTINRIVHSLLHTRQAITDEAIMTIITNIESFYPCINTVLITINGIFDSISESAKSAVVDALGLLLRSDSYILKTEASRSYAIRIISKSIDSTIEPLLSSLFDDGGPIVRREVIYALTHRKQWMVISDLRHEFPRMSRGERRATIMASYILGDEGRHWRNNTAGLFDPFEIFIQDWMKKAGTQ
jgi:hypothetical protein